MAEVKSDFLFEIRRSIGDKKYHMSLSGKIISSKKGGRNPRSGMTRIGRHAMCVLKVSGDAGIWRRSCSTPFLSG